MRAFGKFFAVPQVIHFPIPSARSWVCCVLIEAPIVWSLNARMRTMFGFKTSAAFAISTLAAKFVKIPVKAIQIQEISSSTRFN